MTEEKHYKDIVLECAVPHEGLVRNMRATLARRLPVFSELAATQEGTSTPVALCGGGPSLYDNLDKLRNFPGIVVACGSTHDPLIRAGIIPDYAVIGDPLPVIVTHLAERSPTTQYLVGSFVDPCVLDRLKDDNVRIWHVVAVSIPEDIPFEEWDWQPVIPGGTSAILRAWPMMAVIGYRDFHFFGFDCSFNEDGKQYAYHRADTENIPPPFQVMIQQTGQKFWTTADLAFQSKEFNNMLEMSSGKFKVTLYGDGLAAASFAVKIGKAA